MNVLRLQSCCSWGVHLSTGFLSHWRKGKEVERCLPCALAPFLVLAVGEALAARSLLERLLQSKHCHLLHRRVRMVAQPEDVNS